MFRGAFGNMFLDGFSAIFTMLRDGGTRFMSQAGEHRGLEAVWFKHRSTLLGLLPERLSLHEPDTEHDTRLKMPQHLHRLLFLCHHHGSYSSRHLIENADYSKLLWRCALDALSPDPSGREPEGCFTLNPKPSSSGAILQICRTSGAAYAFVRQNFRETTLYFRSPSRIFGGHMDIPEVSTVV